MVLEMLLTEMWMSLYKVSQQLKFMLLVQCTGQIEAKSIQMPGVLPEGVDVDLTGT